MGYTHSILPIVAFIVLLNAPHLLLHNPMRLCLNQSQLSTYPNRALRNREN